MKTFRHAGIVVTNMNRSLRFYRDLLGLKVVRDLDESGDYIDNMNGLKGIRVRTVKLSADKGESLIELLCFKSHPKKLRGIEPFSIGPTHVAFEVYDLEKEYKRLKKSRVKFNAPPQFSPDGYAKVTFCKDPDGTLIEFVELLKEK